MAEDTKDAAVDEAAAKPKSKKKLIIILVLALLLVGGGGGAAYYFLMSSHDAEEGVAEEETPPKPLSYYGLETPLISNMTATSRLVQVKIALATDGEPTILEGVKAHETAIRAELLTQLMTADGDSLSSREGKMALQTSMRKAVNAELEKRVGEGGITEVLFTDMVIQ